MLAQDRNNMKLIISRWDGLAVPVSTCEDNRTRCEARVKAEDWKTRGGTRNNSSCIGIAETEPRAPTQTDEERKLPGPRQDETMRPAGRTI